MPSQDPKARWLRAHLATDRRRLKLILPAEVVAGMEEQARRCEVSPTAYVAAMLSLAPPTQDEILNQVRLLESRHVVRFKGSNKGAPNLIGVSIADRGPHTPSQSTLTPIQVFIAATAALRSKPWVPQKWLKERIIGKANGICWHCGEHAILVMPLFSSALGGGRAEQNLVAACARCRVCFADLDPLTPAWEAGELHPRTKAEQRLEALAACLQHLVPPRVRTSAAVGTAWLKGNRWTFPRQPLGVFCGAHQTWIAPVSASPGTSWTSLLQLLKQAGCRSVEGIPSVMEVDSPSFQEIAWTLIEHGALLTPVDVRGLPEFRASEAGKNGPSAWRRQWNLRLRGVSGAIRGRQIKQRSDVS